MWNLKTLNTINNEIIYNENTSHQCNICYEFLEKNQIIFYDCGHLLCLNCNQHSVTRRCHMCRIRIKNCYKIKFNNLISCNICFRHFNRIENQSKFKPFTLLCGHLYCLKCFVTCLKVNNKSEFKCEICRKKSTPTILYF